MKTKRVPKFCHPVQSYEKKQMGFGLNFFFLDIIFSGNIRYMIHGTHIFDSIWGLLYKLISTCAKQTIILVKSPNWVKGIGTLKPCMKLRKGLRLLCTICLP